MQYRSHHGLVVISIEGERKVMAVSEMMSQRMWVRESPSFATGLPDHSKTNETRSHRRRSFSAQTTSFCVAGSSEFGALQCFVSAGLHRRKVPTISHVGANDTSISSVLLDYVPFSYSRTFSQSLRNLTYCICSL
jgi:hypothetical protein